MTYMQLRENNNEKRTETEYGGWGAADMDSFFIYMLTNTEHEDQDQRGKKQHLYEKLNFESEG